MSIECSECEHDLRGGHAKECSRYDPSHECPECGDVEYFQYDDGERQCERCGRRWTPNAQVNAPLAPGEKHDEQH